MDPSSCPDPIPASITDMIFFVSDINLLDSIYQVEQVKRNVTSCTELTVVEMCLKLSVTRVLAEFRSNSVLILLVLRKMRKKYQVESHTQGSGVPSALLVGVFDRPVSRLRGHFVG
jgi:hypothetical protein